MKINCLISLVLLSLCALSINAGIIGHLPLPIAELDESPPQYEFHYSVHDSHTGDVKDQFEHRRGDYVTGRYSLIEPDGHRRIVDYSSDPLLGFTAQVRRESPHGGEVVEDWPAQPARHR